MRYVIASIAVLVSALIGGCDSDSASHSAASEGPSGTNTAPVYQPVYKTPEARQAAIRAGGDPDAKTPVYGKANGELVITLREKNARAIAGGKPIVVDLVPTEGFSPHHILVSSQYGNAAVEVSPYSASLEVPKDAVGTFKISAVGFDANWNVAASNIIELPIEIPAKLVGFKITNGFETPEGFVIPMFSISPTHDLVVYGKYDDGVNRALQTSGAKLTYSTEDPKIASVDVAGKLTAHSVGTTRLTVSMGSVSTTVLVMAKDDEGIWRTASP